MPDDTDIERLEQLAAQDERYETAAFGREVELFIDEHPVGKFIVDQARADLELAKERLLTVDPEDPSAIRALQQKAAVAESVRQWLAMAIENGRNAADLLQQERDEHGT
jgi:hypothetical protein